MELGDSQKYNFILQSRIDAIAIIEGSDLTEGIAKVINAEIAKGLRRF